MTSLSLQKRAREHIAQPVPWSIKNLTAFGVAANKSATVVSEIAKISFMMDKEYCFPQNLSLRWRKLLQMQVFLISQDRPQFVPAHAVSIS